MTLPDDAYAKLLALRTGLRHFEAWSARQARAVGLTPAHHQLLLAIRGHRGHEGPTIGEVADYLLLRHHSAVGLVDRAEAVGLVERTRSEADHRIVRLGLTPDGAARLEELSALHLEELERLAVDGPGAWAGLAPVHGPHGLSASPESKPASGVEVDVAHVDDDLPRNATGVLVDRWWPRGLAKEDTSFDMWAKEVAPSTELRKWYGQETGRFEEFGRRYRKELARSPAKEALAELRAQADVTPLVLLTAAKDIKSSAATVLQQMLAGR